MTFAESMEELASVSLRIVNLSVDQSVAAGEREHLTSKLSSGHLIVH